MQFRSPSGTIHVNTVFGHSAIVGTDWRELPEILHRPALAAGCECDATHIKTEAPKAETAADAPKRTLDADQVIRETLELMLAREEPKDFTADGSPNAKVVSHLSSMNVRKEDVMRVFRAMQAEAGKE